MVRRNSKDTEKIIKLGSYIKKKQPKNPKQEYDHKKEKVAVGSKEESLKINKVLELVKKNLL